ncbi:hypothetical protein [Chryseobacterium defluvii]|uniref:Uncharacterized protein n=1 Tax=Chryseobacterium defluvii TaxID=160396 RepID=A0A495SLP0_9FLAO|nr:hypothetical protein [Chryseobacterium defluvii]RKT01093.1 hypothetical protein BCF58_0307 [Chryseobacterium defluvii]
MKIIVERLGNYASIENLEVISDSNWLKTEIKDIIEIFRFEESSGLNKMQLILTEINKKELYNVKTIGFDQNEDKTIFY